MSKAPSVLPRLFQFWDAREAPAYIEELMATWSRETAYLYCRYNRDTAADFIASVFDARTLDAYLSCGVPAMQADFFRLCALYRYGGVYIDADSENAGGLPELVRQGRRGVLFLRAGKLVANDFMAVHFAHDPLMAFALQRAVANIEARIANDVWHVTGPGILTELYHSDRPEKEMLFDGYFIDDVVNIRKVVAFRQDLPYKQTGVHWYGNNDIYIDVSPSR